MKGRLIVFSGPSGVGKGTIRKNLKFKDYVFSISSTTRNKRAEEVDGVDYFFISKQEFQQKIKQQEMLEYAEFVDNYYGTDRTQVEKLLASGHNVFLEIECQGALQVIKQIPDVISIFILPPSLAELQSRLQNRGTEQPDVIAKRITKARAEMELKSLYKYNVVNDNLEQVVKQLDKIFIEEFNEIN